MRRRTGSPRTSKASTASPPGCRGVGSQAAVGGPRAARDRCRRRCSPRPTRRCDPVMHLDEVGASLRARRTRHRASARGRRRATSGARARPISIISQPIPTAPGPNWSQNSCGTGAVCSRSSRVCSVLGGEGHVDPADLAAVLPGERERGRRRRTRAPRRRRCPRSGSDRRRDRSPVTAPPIHRGTRSGLVQGVPHLLDRGRVGALGGESARLLPVALDRGQSRVRRPAAARGEESASASPDDSDQEPMISTNPDMSRQPCRGSARRAGAGSREISRFGLALLPR